jgi:hypothetical protein
MEALSAWMTTLGLATFVNDHGWVWPVCEIFHFVGMSILVGCIGVLDLRMLGFFKGLSMGVLERLVPLGLLGFAFNLISGFIFVAGNAAGSPLDYLTNLSFQLKMICIFIAGLNALAFYVFGVARALANAGPDADATGGAKLIAVSSIVLWLAVIFFGRLIMYNDTLLYALGI